MFKNALDYMDERRDPGRIIAQGPPKKRMYNMVVSEKHYEKMGEQ